VAAVVKAVAPRPVNVLASAPIFTVGELSDLGVRRVSVGGALARAALGALLRAAEEIAGPGTFRALGEAPPHAQLNGLFQRLSGRG
jgi:2-methylisocitrate lyase-like PEP mutase family enzyme